MKRVWKKIDGMIKRNAKHLRKDFKLGEVDFPSMLQHVKDELAELETSPDDPNEMADILGILIHYSIKQGWTMELLEHLLVEKLNLRFK
jgi:hypothetical protein